MVVKAGTVIIDVEPNTKGFYRKVKDAMRGLRDIEVDATLNTRGLDDQLRRFGNRDERVEIKAVLDNASLMRDAERTRDRMRRDMAAKPVEIPFDKRGLSKSMKDMLAEHASFERKMTSLTSRESRLRNREWVSASGLVGDLTAKHRELESQLKAETAEYEKGRAKQTKALADMSARYEELAARIDQAKDARDRFKRGSSEYRVASDYVKSLQKEYSALARDIEAGDRALDKFDAKHAKSIAALHDQSASTVSQLDKARGALRDVAASMGDIDHRANRVGDGLNDINLGMVHATDNAAKWRGEVFRQSRAQDKWNKALSSLNPVLGDADKAVRRMDAATGRYNGTLRASADATNRFKTKQRETVRQLEQAEDSIKTMMDGLRKLNTIDTSGLRRELNGITDRINGLHKLASKPIKLNNAFATSGINEDLDRLADKYTAFTRRMEREQKINMRVQILEDDANKVEDRLNRLRSKHLDLPVDIQVDMDRVQSQLREAARNIRMNPEHDWEAELNVDLDLARAERRIKDFERDHDKLDMDVDLETALARAHLAYFTRPRTVDIFAKFHGTDLGKILSGMTAGATGLQGVQNQFQRLVNLFDNFDTIVPKVSALGTALAGVGAGAINLSGSVLGVGSSLVTMSKAALAAPAALTGLGAAYASLRMIIGDKGEAWKENISLAGTELENMAEKVQKAFYGKAAPAIKELGKQVGDVLSPAMVQLAAHEGEIVEGMTRMVIESNKVGQVERVFSNVNASLSKLQPGIESVVKSFINLGDSTSDYLPRAAAYLSDMADQFARWVDNARLSGQINQSMAQVVEQAGYLKTTLKGVVDIASGLYHGLAEQQNGLEGFSSAVRKAADVVNGVRFQETLTEWSAGAADAKENMRGSFSAIGDAAYELRTTTADVFRNAGTTIGSFASNISRVLSRSKTGISDFSSGVSDGFQRVFDAVGDAAPMFSQLLTTAGQLSKTFGGTLAASLKAAAPLVQAVAKGAEAVANAFAKLPEPVQAAIGLWATFGRAGKSAFDSLKIGVLESTGKMLSYRKMLNDLGVTATGLGVGMKDAVKGFAAASPALSSVTGAVGQATGKLGKFKALASGLFSAVNWPTAGAIAAVGAVGMALADMSEKSSSNRQIVDDLSSAFGRLADEGYDASTSLNTVQQALKDALDNPDLGETSWLDDWGSWFSDTQSAMHELGVTTTEAMNVASGSTEDFQKELKRLGVVIDTGTQAEMGNFTAATGDMNESMVKSGKAAAKYQKSLESLRKKYIDAAVETGTANGYTEEYVKSLIEAGVSSDELSAKISSQEQQQRMAAQATKLHVNALNDQRTAARNAMSAASNYQATLSGMKDTVARVKELTNDQNKVWDDTSTLLPGVEGAFNTMSESGRLAQQSLETLGSSAHDVMEKMVESGASAEQVTASTSKMRDEFIQTAIDMGVPKQAAEQLAQQYGLIPEEVDTLIKVHTDEAKSAITMFLSNLYAAFPEDGKIIDMVMQMTLDGNVKDMEDAYNKIQELRNNPDVKVLLSVTEQNSKQKIEDVKNALRGLGIDWPAKIDVQSDEGRAKVQEVYDKLKELGMKPEQIQIILDTLGAEQGIIGLKDQIENERAKMGVDADTDSAKNKVSSFIDDQSDVKTIPADIALGEADGQLATWAAVVVKKPVQTEVEQPSLMGTIASIAALVKSSLIPPAKIRVEGDDTDAQTKINAVRAFGGQTLAEMWAHILGEDSLARSSIGAIAAYDGQTIAKPWARVQGEHTLASAAIRAISLFNGKTIAKPWARVQGENAMARAAIAAVQIFNGLTIARPWARVQGDDSGAQAVFSSIASTNGSVLATRYVDIVTRSSGSVKAATGGRIHGPGSGTSDSIPAMLSNNEHVIRAASVARIDREVGPNFLNVLNRTGDLSKALANANNRYLDSARSLARGAYATGGRVKTMFSGAANVHVDGGKTVNQTFNLQTKVVRSDQDLHAAAQIDRAALMRTARREARI